MCYYSRLQIERARLCGDGGQALLLLPARSRGDVVTGAQRGAGDTGQLRDAQPSNYRDLSHGAAIIRVTSHCVAPPY